MWWKEGRKREGYGSFTPSKDVLFELQKKKPKQNNLLLLPPPPPKKKKKPTKQTPTP